MKPSRVSILQLLETCESAMDFKQKCKEAFGWSDKKFLSYTCTNHAFNLLKNRKDKEYIKQSVFNI